MIKRNIIYDISLSKILEGLFNDELNYSLLILEDKIKKECGYTFIYSMKQSKVENPSSIVFDIDFDFSIYEKNQHFNDIKVKIHYNVAFHGYDNEIFWFDFNDEIEKEYKEKFSTYEKKHISLAINMSDSKNSPILNKRL